MADQKRARDQFQLMSQLFPNRSDDVFQPNTPSMPPMTPQQHFRRDVQQRLHTLSPSVNMSVVPPNFNHVSPQNQQIQYFQTPTAARQMDPQYVQSSPRSGPPQPMNQQVHHGHFVTPNPSAQAYNSEIGAQIVSSGATSLFVGTPAQAHNYPRLQGAVSQQLSRQSQMAYPQDRAAQMSRNGLAMSNIQYPRQNNHFSYTPTMANLSQPGHTDPRLLGSPELQYHKSPHLLGLSNAYAPQYLDIGAQGNSRDMYSQERNSMQPSVYTTNRQPQQLHVREGPQQQSCASPIQNFMDTTAMGQQHNHPKPIHFQRPSPAIAQAQIQNTRRTMSSASAAPDTRKHTNLTVVVSKQHDELQARQFWTSGTTCFMPDPAQVGPFNSNTISKYSEYADEPWQGNDNFLHDLTAQQELMEELSKVSYYDDLNVGNQSVGSFGLQANARQNSSTHNSHPPVSACDQTGAMLQQSFIPQGISDMPMPTSLSSLSSNLGVMDPPNIQRQWVPTASEKRSMIGSSAVHYSPSHVGSVPPFNATQPNHAVPALDRKRKSQPTPAVEDDTAKISKKHKISHLAGYDWGKGFPKSMESSRHSKPQDQTPVLSNNRNAANKHVRPSSGRASQKFRAKVPHSRVAAASAASRALQQISRLKQATTSEKQAAATSASRRQSTAGVKTKTATSARSHKAETVDRSNPVYENSTANSIVAQLREGEIKPKSDGPATTVDTTTNPVVAARQQYSKTHIGDIPDIVNNGAGGNLSPEHVQIPASALTTEYFPQLDPASALYDPHLVHVDELTTPEKRNAAYMRTMQAALTRTPPDMPSRDYSHHTAIDSTNFLQRRLAGSLTPPVTPDRGDLELADVTNTELTSEEELLADGLTAFYSISSKNQATSAGGANVSDNTDTNNVFAALHKPTEASVATSQSTAVGNSCGSDCGPTQSVNKSSTLEETEDLITDDNLELYTTEELLRQFEQASNAQAHIPTLEGTIRESGYQYYSDLSSHEQEALGQRHA